MMSDLLHMGGRGAGGASPIYDGWSVRSVDYAHTAAKFWPRLIDEALAAFPACRVIELAAPGAGVLTRGLLRPEHALEQSLHRLDETDPAQEREAAVTELELFGVPAGVRIRLLEADVPTPLHEEVLDAVDEEVFPNLLVWLLEWSGIDAALWNNEFVHGEFSAEDSARRLRYRIVLDARNRFLSEGLYSRTIRIEPDRTDTDGLSPVDP